MSDRNIDFYQQNAGTFFADTVEVDMTALYRRFLPLLPDRAEILDAGCGSGRDAKTFAGLGHRLTAFGATPALAALAERHHGQSVHCMRFQDIAWQDEFDGIWACASLLHVPAAELPDVLQRLCLALKSDGVLYASFKYGSGEGKTRDRPR